MTGAAADVTAYIENARPEHQAALTALRQLCRETLTGYAEGMDYGLPSYKRGDEIELGFASRKNYVALYITKVEVVEANSAALAGLNCGKSCIRFTRPAKMDLEVVRRLLLDTRISSAEPS